MPVEHPAGAVPTAVMPGGAPGELLTRRQGAEYIRDIMGRPFSFSTATKLAALGEFAEPDRWWGRRPLYSRETLRAWVEARERRMQSHKIG